MWYQLKLAVLDDFQYEVMAKKLEFHLNNENAVDCSAERSCNKAMAAAVYHEN